LQSISSLSAGRFFDGLGIAKSQFGPSIRGAWLTAQRPL